MVSVKIVPNKTAKKQYLLRFFIEIFGYKTFVKIYLILPEILSVINSRESGFSRILKSEGVTLGKTLHYVQATRVSRKIILYSPIINYCFCLLFRAEQLGILVH
jgi:hypothetical protein